MFSLTRLSVAAKEALWILLLTLVGLAVRWPYWRTIPLPGDETNQATLAMHIARGEILPLTGTDAYTGPFFVYLMAGLYRLGVTDPLLGRTLLLITGTLLIPITYALARRLTGSWRASGVAAALIATNPHLVVLSSHHGAATTLMPFFIGLFVWWALESIERDHGGWWLAAVVAGGLALQANLAAVVPLAGAGLWFAYEAWQKPGLRRRWWLWLGAAAAIVVLLSAPVLIQSLLAQVNPQTKLEARGYLWESNPTLHTYALNFARLLLQIGRQTAGVLGGAETLEPLLGLPLVFIGWAIGGLVALPMRARWLAAAAIVPFAIVPWFSAHFGILGPVRFTSYMTLFLSTGMGALVEFLWRLLETRAPRWRNALLALALATAALPLQGLMGYYAYAVSQREDGAIIEGFVQDVATVAPGAKLYIVFSDAMLAGFGVPYIWEAYATMQGRAFEFVPFEQVLGRLYTEPGQALILCTEAEAARFAEFATLTEVVTTRPVDYQRLGYRLYRHDPATLRRPRFVLTDPSGLHPQLSLEARVGELELIGADLPAEVAAGGTATLTLYWRRVDPLAPDTYTLFVHVFLPDGTALVAQTDRVLGQAVYPVNAWGADEVVVDTVGLSVPAEAAPGAYPLRVGVYRYPSLARLPVPGTAENVIELPPLIVR